MNRNIFIIIVIIVNIFVCNNLRSQVAKDVPENYFIPEEKLMEFNYAFTEAEKEKLFGNYKKAVSLLLRCLEINPYSSAVYYQLSLIHIHVGDNNNALKFARKSVYFDKDNYWFNLNLAKLYDINNEIDSAISIYDNLLHIYPGHIELKYEYVIILIKAEKFKNAIKVLNAIEKEFGISEKVSLAKENIYERMNKHDLAIKELEKLILVYSDNIQYYGILAELYGILGDNKNAEKTYQKILTIDSTSLISMLSYAEFKRGQKSYDTAYIYLKKIFKHQDAQINILVEELISIFSNKEEFDNNLLKIEELVKILISRYPLDYKAHTINADFYIRIQKYDKAIASMQYLLKQDKENYIVWEQLLYIYNLTEDYEKLDSLADEAILIFPDKSNLYLFDGIALMQKSNYDQAINRFLKGLDYISSTEINLKIQFYTFLGECYYNIIDYSNSDIYFNKVIEIDSSNLYVLNNYSYYLALRRDKLEIAEKLSRRTLEIEPNNHTYLDTYGWILYQLNRIDEAKIYIEKALEYGGNKNAEILDHYGDILFKHGDKENAKIFWNKALEFGGNIEIKDKLLK